MRSRRPTRFGYTAFVLILGVVIIVGCHLLGPDNEELRLLAFTTSLVCAGSTFGEMFGKWLGFLFALLFAAIILWTFGSPGLYISLTVLAALGAVGCRVRSKVGGMLSPM